ncbi:hypothetical protein BsWGS_23491 [Bradybaena similaris]
MHASSWRAPQVLLLYAVLISLTEAQLVWVKKPQNRAVALGNDLILPCEAQWLDKSNTSVVLSYTWSLDDGNLTSKASRFLNNSLFMSTVSLRELGNYSCTVTSRQRADIDQTNSTAANLTGTAVVIAAYIEPFIVDPVSLEGVLGEQISLTCVTGRGAPNLQVQWLRNNEVFTEGETLTAAFGDHDPTGLSIQLSMKLTVKISARTHGSFECVAVNDILMQEVRSQQANVSIKVIPSADRPTIEWNLPHSLIVAEGWDLILPCQVVESTEPAKIVWYEGQFKVDESRQLYVLPNTSLGFLPVGPKDSGNYSCTAENSKGVTRSPSVQVTVAYLGVSFRGNPSDAHAIYGQDVILRCNPPESIPPAAIIWYKNYLPLDLHPGRVMVIDNDLHLISVRKTDTGLYYCVAFNNFTTPSSRTSNTARLTVEGPPLMIQPLINTKIVKGKLLHLTCLVDSDPAPVTTWQFEDGILPLSSKVAVVNHGQDLWINDIGKDWEGRFTCLSKNKYGSTSASAFVTVLVPPASLRPIETITVMSGKSVFVPCHVVCDPMPVIHWFFGDIRVSVNGSLASAGSIHWTFIYPDLYIQHAQPQHAGKYSCIGSNEAGNASSSGWLIVHTLPVISQAPRNTTAIIGSLVTLDCQAIGNPLPSLHWLYNSTTQIPAGVRVKDNSSLVLLTLGWDNVGAYTCVADSITGTAQTTAMLQLMVPPTIEAIQFPTTPVRMHSSFRLSCTTSGIPTPLVQWTRFDEPVQATLNGRVQLPEMGLLVVNVAWKNDSGQYECWAISRVGTHRKAISVIVYGPPSPPVLLRAVPLSSESVYLIWESSYHANTAERADKFQISFWDKINGVVSVYPVTFLKNETRAEVVGLQPATEYVFCVLAMNDAGTGPPSNLMSAITLQSSPSLPVNLHVGVVTSSNATLIWEVPSSPNGVVKMYQLRYRRSSSTDQDFTHVNITGRLFPTNEFVLSPLLPYTDYVAQVRAGNVDRGLNLWGDYSSVTFHTLAAKPSLPPQFIQVSAVDPYSLNISWQQIPVLAQNGPILCYYVTYTNNESQQSSSAKVDASVTSYLIRGLSPWRHYLMRLRGENEAGLGPVSDLHGATTLPVAPVAPPSNFKSTANSASSLKLSWKALQGDLVTCNITAYIVEFRQPGQSPWGQIAVPSNASTSSFTYLLEFLLPWEWYECRVAAFTSTLTSGMGPFTDVIVVRTLQGVSTAVTFFSYTSNATVILLSWQPPKHIQGVLSGYKVVFQALANASVADAMEMITVSEAAVLQDLLPDTVYNISVAAGNAAGWGDALVVLIQTLPVSSAIFWLNETDLNDTASFESSNSTTYWLSQSDNSHITKNLASIVAGSIVGAIALIVMTVFICIKCLKYRQKQRLTYDVDSDTVGVDGTSYRSLEPSSDIVIISSSKLFQVADSHSPSPAADAHSPYTSRSALDDEVQIVEHVDSRNSRKGHSEKEEKQRRPSLPRISLPILSLAASPYSVLKEHNGSSRRFYNGESKGIDNLGFAEISVEPAEDDLRQQFEVNARPRLDGVHLSVATDDTVSVSSETQRRRNRMRNDNAAAIAAMRNSQTICHDDTDTLVDSESIDSEVIFNERTVL